MEHINRYRNEEWKQIQEPFQVAPHTYFVGTKFVSCWLVDTGKGLILIDQGLAETLYLVLESIRKLRFDPRDIRMLLLSHGHFDHCGGTRLLKEYTGAEVWLSEEDDRNKKEHPEWVWLGYDNAIDFAVDRHYTKEPIVLGNISILPVATPGHTPGTTSFFWYDADSDGRCWLCGMHGGLGFNTLTKEFYAAHPGWPEGLPRLYGESLEKVSRMPVDIPLPSHPNQIPILDKAGTYDRKENPFVNPAGWRVMIEERRERLEEYL